VTSVFKPTTPALLATDELLDFTELLTDEAIEDAIEEDVIELNTLELDDFTLDVLEAAEDTDELAPTIP